MTNVYRAAVIGCGRMGSLLDDELYDREVQDESWRERPCTFAGNFSAHPRTMLVAGSDTSARRLARFGEKWEVEALYHDYEEMLSNESLDIVGVATHSHLHHPMTIAAARAGVKAIFCEKPLAASLDEADEMIRVCEENGVKLIVNHTAHFHPNLPRAKALIEDGRIGDLRLVMANFTHWLVHNGSHMFDLFTYFAGEPISVFGHLDGDGAEDGDGSGYVQFRNGVRGFADSGPKVPPSYVELIGTEGALRFAYDGDYTFSLRLSTGETPKGYPPRLEQHPFPGVGPDEERRGPRQGRYACPTAIDEIVRCIDQNVESSSNGRQARRAMEITAGIFNSHRAGGCTIELPNQHRSLYIPEKIPSTTFQAQEQM